MNARDIARKSFEWIFRRAALRDARAGLPAADDQGAVATRQAKLLLEITRRTAEPAQALPAGALPAVTLGLCREVIYWALAARRADGGTVPSDLRALWDAAQPQTSSASPPDPDPNNDASAALRRTLFDDYAPHSLAVTDAEAARAREFAEALVWDLDAPRRKIERVLIQRWLRIGLLGAVVILLAIGGRVLMLGPNLAAGKPFRLSSTFSGWAACVASTGCAGLMFHTETEPNPWVELDLGMPQKVSRVEVINRGDCCADRATPLVVEVSTDRAVWTPVARRKEPFGSWTASFPARVARYVRLSVPRRTVLHLQAIAVR
jgi:hypothetical protein